MYFKLNITLLRIPTGRLFTSVAENLKAGVRVQHGHAAEWSAYDTELRLHYSELYGKTDMKKMKTAMHDNDFAQKSK